MKGLSFARLLAVFVKEFQQMLRDRLTFAMAVGVPVLQLVLFGYAINTDPKGLPTAVVAQDSGPFTRSLLAALQNTGYFRVTHPAVSEAQADELLAQGAVQFIVVDSAGLLAAPGARRAPGAARWRWTRPTPRPRATRSPR